MPILGCGAELSKVMQVSDEDIAVIEESLADRLEMGESQASAQKNAVADAIAQLQAERDEIMQKVLEQIPVPKKPEPVAVAEPVAESAEPVAERKNSVAQPTDQTQTAAFKRWFGDSKVVDADGKPLVVYHGTKGDFSEFDIGQFGKTDGGWAGKGFYFSPWSEESGWYSKGEGGNIMPVYLSIQNPLEWRVGTEEGRKLRDKKRELGADGFSKWAQEQGYDGVHMTSPDIGSTRGQNEWIAFNPTQIKSAIGNNGDFDGTSPDIRRSVAAPGQQPTTQTQPRSLWRDETNRLQFAPGAWLWEKLGENAGPLLSMAGLKTASPELRAQLRRMKLDVQKAQETAAKVATSTAKFSEEERAMVSDLVEKTVKAGTVPPEHAIKLAGLIDQVMSKQTDELIELGMLSKDTAERWRGQYLPRYYETKMRGKDAWTAAMDGMMRRARLMKGIGGKHLKGRGLFETVPVEKQADYEALGWEVRDPDFDATKDKTVQMWRDFTPEERAEMGEIRDAGFRFVMGYMQTQKDIALGRMFRSIANDENLSSRTQTGEFTVKVPDTKVEGTGAFVYGALAGRYVSRETLSVLSSQSEAQNDLLVAYRKALGLWKEGKTVLNPVSHVNNMVSNVTMAHLAGVSYHRGDKYLMAVRDFAKGDKMVKEAKDAGLFLGGFNESELFNSMPAELKELAQKAESRVESGVNTAMNVMTLWLRKPMQNAYGFEDDFFKYLIYKDARSRGATPDAAVDYAQRYIFTYDDLPKTARIIRDSALPFFSYTYKAVPALLHTALTHPVRIATPAALMYGATMMAYAIAASEADEPWDEIVKRYLSDDAFRNKVGKAQEDAQKNLPPWQRGYTAFMTPKSMLVGHDKVLDLPVYMDISRLIPGGDIFDVAPNAGGVPLPAPITPSHPVLSIGVAMIGNRDLFTGKDIVDKNDTTGEAAGKRADWMWKQISPAITIGNYHYERGMNMVAQASGQPITIFRDYTGRDRMGMPVTADYGLPQTFGIKLRPVDMALSQQIQGGQDSAMVRQIMAEVKQLQRLQSKGAVTQEAVNKEMQKANEKIANIRKGLTVDGDERK